MKITSKGQVTIPQEIRERLGLLPHTEVDCEMRGGVVMLKAVAGMTLLTSDAARYRTSFPRLEIMAP